MRFERTRTVAATRETIWEVLSDFAAIDTWAPNVDHARLLTDQMSGVGTCRRVQVGRMALIETVTAWNPPDGLTYRVEGLPSAVGTVTNSWLIEPGSGFSVVRLVTVVSPTGPSLIGRVAGRRLTAASTLMLGGLSAAAIWKERS